MTITIFLTLFLPIIVCCVILNVIANEQNKRLYGVAGWTGLLVTGWIGTPIHEFSHLIMALISGHGIEEVKLFKPDPKTGSLGYITHTYNPDNLYQSVIGNSLIAIAPFFGGAVSIYLILYFLLPDFSLYSPDVPSVYHISSDALFSPESYVLFGKTSLEFIQFLAWKIFNKAMLSDWKTYAVFFVLMGIANHLSPSRSDFKNFWQPLTLIILFITAINIIILPFTKGSMEIINIASSYIMLVMPLLLLAILISTIGLCITLLIYCFISIFK